MKTTTFKNNILNLIGLLLTLTINVSSYAQKCDGSQISITIENSRSIESKVGEFDVFITNTGSTSLTLAAIQGAVIYDENMLAKGAKTSFLAINQSNKADVFSKFNTITTKHSETTNQLRWFQNPVSLSSGKTAVLPAQKKMKFGSFRIVSSQPINTSLLAKIKPQLTFKFGYTNILATVYCNANLNSVGLKSTVSDKSISNSTNLNAIAYPNPFTDNFNLDVTTTSETPIRIKVYDMLGKLIEIKTVEATEIHELSIGANFPSGIYNVSISQDENTQTIRIIRR